MIRQKWEYRQEISIPEPIRNRFSNPLIGTRLVQLGILDAEQAQSFINPDLYQPTSAFDLPDLEKAVNRLQKAIDQQELIGVWGDFDVDGQTATTLLVEAIRNIGGKVIYHIPNRQKESHGIRIEFLKEFLKQEINLLLTCDTGVSEHESIEYAMNVGIDVIVTDHHSLPDTLPNAVAIVNPQRLPKNHPLKNLAGVGAAYKLIEALYQKNNREEQCSHFLDLVALGTVADVALLNGENRYLVQKGLRQLKTTNRLGLQEIYRLKEIQVETITETHISFVFAPMLNSLGRLDDANPIVEFLTTDNIQKIKTFATSLNNLNEKRKLLTDQITQAVLEKIEQNPEIGRRSIIVVAQEYWHPGILGIVANRIVEQFQKPVILLSGDEKHGLRGSARSIEGINIIDFIREQQEFLDHFGGHAMAAGLSIQFDNLEPFIKRIDQSIQNQIGDQVSQDLLFYDLALKPQEITLEFIEQVLTLAPFGAGNPPFLFCTKNVQIQKQTQIGKNQRHSKLFVQNEQNQGLEVLWWNSDPEQLDDQPLDIIYTLNKSTYKNKEQPQIELVAFQPAASTISNFLHKKRSLTIEDNRYYPTIINHTFPYLADSQIWFEGTTTLPVKTETRSTIGPCHTLIIGFSPPGLKEIQKVVQTCQPEKIILNPIFHPKTNIKELSILIQQMLKYSITQQHGIINLPKMAARIGHRTSTIEIFIEWIAANGQIQIFRHPDTDIFVKLGGEKNPDLARDFSNQIHFLLNETIAFQNWFIKTSIEKLKEELFLF